jgi:hypothetical protein
MTHTPETHFPHDVAHALAVLGNGFLAHPHNHALRDALDAGRLSAVAYYAQLARLVHRVLWLLGAEAQGVLPAPQASPSARQRYLRSYSVERLRRLAAPRRPQAASLYRNLLTVMEHLGSPANDLVIGVPALGHFLQPGPALPDLVGCALADRTMIEAVQALVPATESDASVERLDGQALAMVALAMRQWQPVLHTDPRGFDLVRAPRSHHTVLPPPVSPALVTRLLVTTLDPVLDEACAQANPEAALLHVKICDPACGTGTFLRAAAQRIGGRLAVVRAGQQTPSPAMRRQALYDIIRHCLYGVDIDEPSVEVCRLSLALDALAPETTFFCLDHHIQWGDSLLGATPALLAQGIPDAAFTPIAGDDKPVAAALRKRNQHERLGQMALTFPTAHAAPVPVAPPARLLADAWCAAFLWPKTRQAPAAVTHDTWCWLHMEPARVPTATQATITQLASQYRVLHWHVAFPDVFTLPDAPEAPENAMAGWCGGFDVVLGKLPWQPLTARGQMERAMPLLRYIRRQYSTTTETLQSPLLFLETARLLIRQVGRIGCLIPAQLVTTETAFFQTLLAQGAIVSLHTITNDTRLMPHQPRTMALSLLTLTGSPAPRTAADVVWGVRQLDELDDATRHVALSADDTALLNPNTRTWPVFQTARAAELTRAIYRRVPVLRQQGLSEGDSWGVRTATMLHLTRDATLLRTRQQLRAEGWRLDGEVFRQGQALYVPVYEGAMLRPWGASYDPGQSVVPQYWIPAARVMQAVARVPEALLQAYRTRRADAVVKMLAAWVGGYHLNRGHNTCTRETLAQVYNPMFHALPATPGAWAAAPALEREWPLTPGDLLLIKRQHDALALARYLIEKHCPEWFMAWRAVVEAERMVTASMCPRVGLAQSCTLLRLAYADAALTSCLLANLNSVVVDFCARQKMSGRRLTPAILDQLPVVPPATYAAPCAWDHTVLLRDWVVSRVLELVYTSPALAPWAQDCGYDGPAFRWDATRRRWLHSELEAAYCLIYGLARPDVALILETCLPGQAFQPSEAAANETLPASELILQVYDALHQARETGQAYHSPLAPPPVALHLGQEHFPRMQEKSTASRVHQVDPHPADKYKTCVPLLDLHAVASAFVEGEEVAPEIWCRVPPGRVLRPGMFVAQMVGRAMEPQIPDGAYCLFERQRDERVHALQGRIVLAQHRDIYDPEIGGNYTIRRYAQEQGSGASHSRPTRSVRLLPLHPAYAPIILDNVSTGERHVIATFLTVLETHA